MSKFIGNVHRLDESLPRSRWYYGLCGLLINRWSSTTRNNAEVTCRGCQRVLVTDAASRLGGLDREEGP